MEILLVTGRFPERSETFIYRHAVGLATRGHQVTVLARAGGNWSLYPEPLPDTLHVELAPPDSSLRELRRALGAGGSVLRTSMRSPGVARSLYERCNTDPRTRAHPYRGFLRHLGFAGRRTDLVHFEFLSLGAMYPLARDTLGSPMVVSCRGRDVHVIELQPPALRAAQLECLQQADAVHCVSSEMAREVERLTGRRDGIWVNRPAVETDKIAVRTANTRRGPLRILATGRLVWKKGFDYLLSALAVLAHRGVDFKADILGEGELHAALRYSIADLGLEHRVSLVGGVPSDEVLRRMQETDVFVLSSVEEGISNAVLEAMASGVPIVTTTAGGMVEAVTDGIEGFVVPVRDVKSLADRIERLSADDDLRFHMGRAARQRAEVEFSLRRQIDTFEAMYLSVCTKERA